MAGRLALLLVSLVLAAPPAAGRQRGGPAKAWVSSVVTRIAEADAKAPGEAVLGTGTVTIRVRIGADGALTGAAIEESSGSSTRDARALAAARAAEPFAPPPKTLLTLDGFTELSFPLERGAARRR